MKKKKKLYEGKAKILYETDENDYLIQEFRDEATAMSGAKKGRVGNKGYINNQVSAHVFRYLNSFFVANHFVDVYSDNAMTIRKLEILPFQVIVRNVAAGSLLERSNYQEGDKLPAPLVEYFHKDESVDNPLLSAEEIITNGLCTERELQQINRMALKANAVLRSFFLRRNIVLVDFKLEFGRNKDNRLMIADEISPDTSRLWDVKTSEKLDKDRFRQDLGGVDEAYEEVRRRVFLEHEMVDTN